MPTSFASLPAHERQAFFSLLDEYFQSRPHLLPGGGSSEEGYDNNAGYEQPTATSSAPNPTPIARSQPPAPASRKPATSLVHKAPSSPTGLSTGKSVGRINMASKGAAFGSMIMGQPKPEAPSTAGEAITGTNPRQPNTSSRLPPAPAPRASQQQEPEPPAYGQAEVVYDYNGTESEDLSVKRFQIIDLIEKISDDWWKARSEDGREGIVPSTYVKQM